MNTFIFLLALIVLITSKLKAQQYFLDDEIDTETAGEVVSVEHSIRKRSIPEISIKIMNRGTESEFILQSSDGFLASKDTKVWVGRMEEGKFKYTLRMDIMDKVNVTFYHDVKTKSAIAHTVNEDGISEFNGVINSDKIIRSLSNHDRKRRDVSSELQHESLAKTGSKNYHLLHKRQVSRNKNYDTKNTNGHKVAKLLLTPKIVYPEILVFVDVALFLHHKKDIVKTVAYVLTIFNGADLYFRELSNPIIRLNIAGIVVCQGRQRIVPMSVFDASRIHLDEFGKFLYKEDQFKFIDDYDVAILLGKTRPIVSDSDSGVVAGRANIRSVCKKNDTTEMIMSTAIIIDNTILSGVHASAHELSHLFGSEHDYFGETDLSADDIKACTFKKGFIMSYKRHDQNQFYYSKCSKEMMQYTLSRPDAICIYNDPADKITDSQNGYLFQTNQAEQKKSNQILRVLPGQYITLDEQCQKRGYARANRYVGLSVCLELQCIEKSQGNILLMNTYEAALDGTPCDTEKVCLRGECVKLPFDKNPDIKLLFPTLYQELKTNKSAEEQCTKLGYNNSIGSFIEDCHLYCLNENGTNKIINHGPTNDGTVCNINGTCKSGKCVDDFYKSAEDHCKRSGQSALHSVNNIRERKCKIICEIWSYNVTDAFNDNYFDKNILENEISAPDGIICDNNAHCQNGQCVDIPSTEISTSTKSSILDSSTIYINVPKKFATPSEQCEAIGLPFIESYNDGCMIACDGKYDDLTAPEGYPCIIDNNVGGYCTDGVCEFKKFKSIISPSSIGTTSSSIHSTLFVSETSVKIQTHSEQCESIGLTLTETYNNGCMIVCDGKNDDLSAPEEYPCVIDQNTVGYCESGICKVREFNTSTVSTVDKTPSNKLPNDDNSPIKKCNDAGFKSVWNLENFDCIIVCSTEAKLDYDDEDNNDVLYQEIYQSNGAPCEYNGHCMDGQCVNMTMTDGDKLLKVEDDAFVERINKQREKVLLNAENLFNNEENGKKHNAPIDLSDIDDDVKEFADDIDVNI